MVSVYFLNDAFWGCGLMELGSGPGVGRLRCSFVRGRSLHLLTVVFGFLLPISVKMRSVIWIAFVSIVALGLMCISSPTRGRQNLG